MTSWIRVNFVPSPTPVFAHKLNPRDTTTLREQIAGWLIEHQYGDELAIPVKSRVVAGVMRDGEVLPVHTTLSGFVGVYPEGEAPAADVVERARKGSS